MKNEIPPPAPPRIKDEQGNEVAIEVIAAEIVKISEGFEAMSKSRLTRRAILILLKDATGMGISDIDRVLKASENLKYYLKR
jgi:hypothetical protein